MDISSMLEVQVSEYKEGDTKENLTPIDVGAPALPSYADISQDEERFFQLMFNGDIASIRFRKLHCTACDAHIGSAPSSANNMMEHPVLRTLLCAKCHEFYGDGTFEQGDDETDMFCRWCANGGNLYCCATCSNTFCNKCIKRNFDPSIRKKIEEDESWRCFVCDPTDLYPLRSMCRAIIQHVQTVARLLQFDKRMSPKEIEEKMNLDESPCCPRKRKRRRRRTGSNSSDEDETYHPNELDASSVPTKRRRTRRSQNVLTNGDVDEEEEEDEKDVKMDLDENSLPVLHCEQTMIESENEIVAPDGKIIKAPLQAPPPKPPVRLPTLKKVVAINPIPTAHLLKSSPMFQTRKIKINNSILELRPQIVVRSNQRPNAAPPMVAIPGRATTVLQKKPKQRILLPKLNRANSQSTEPSVINLDSDDEDLVVLDANRGTDKENDKLRENSNNNGTESPTQEKTYDRILSPTPQSKDHYNASQNLKQFLIQKNREIDTVLNTMKWQLKKIVNDPANYDDPNEVARKVKGVYKTIYKSIHKFAEQSDVIAHGYDRWCEQRRRAETKPSEDEESRPKTPEKSSELKKCSEDLSLEMVCSNESDEENVDDDENSMSLTSFQARTSMFDNFVFFRKRFSKDVAVGDTDLSVREIGTQADDVQERDLEMCIGHSVLMKVSFDEKTGEETTHRTIIPDENHGKYLEQYCYFLQKIENDGIETNDDLGVNQQPKKILPDPNETPLKDLIEANSPFISEMLQIDSPVLTNGACAEPEPDQCSSDGFATTNLHAVDDLAEIVTKLSNDMECEKTKDETVCAVQALIEENALPNKKPVDDECMMVD